MAALVWFQNDLRIHDHAALSRACAGDAPVICLYVHDDDSGMGAASNAWLHHALKNLAGNLKRKNLVLSFAAGKSEDVIPALAAKHKVTSVHAIRNLEPEREARMLRVKEKLNDVSFIVERSDALSEPEDMKPYRVFTPYYKACLARGYDLRSVPEISGATGKDAGTGISLDDLKLLPDKLDWDEKMLRYWEIGEEEAHQRLDDFLDEAGSGYATQRDIPGIDGTSRLSPYLHFGQITARQIWRRCENDNRRHAAFQRELVWREFAAHLLHHNPSMPTEPLQPNFKDFPWQANAAQLQAWKEGRTGYPIVDAGMRQLWETGWMHNRVRMIVASFLVKHLLQPWQDGEAWFWDCLVDADLASNSVNWQWVAGCGADAAPYFRVFNPILQGQKFDPKGAYVRRWCPELNRVPDALVHTPWMSTEKLDYPPPIMDHDLGRKRALEAYDRVKKR